jgi:hypothetical protein
MFYRLAGNVIGVLIIGCMVVILIAVTSWVVSTLLGGC